MGWSSQQIGYMNKVPAVFFHYHSPELALKWLFEITKFEEECKQWVDFYIRDLYKDLIRDL